MNFIFDKYDIFTNKPIELSTPIFTIKNYLILKYINNYNNDFDQSKIEKFVNIWLNMKYLNCTYPDSLQNQAIKYFGRIDDFK